MMRILWSLVVAVSMLIACGCGGDAVRADAEVTGARSAAPRWTAALSLPGSGR
jgi:hypothetical protein